ncbi:MAG: secretin N-terminal domain-containing protein [Candidatus Omnitrophica bacterium]|nr:secretin N-terminal domain-containing protein [Candidatus Omnitrophota bacterium]
MKTRGMQAMRSRSALIILAVAIASAGLSAAVPALDKGVTPILREKFNKDVTLDLRDMDIIDVFKFLSMKGDFSIVVSKAVQGRATLVLKSVKIGDALDIIAIANGLGYRAMEENIVYIMPEEEYFQMYGTYFRNKTRVKTVYLKYVRPSYALEALKNVKSEVGKIVIDEDTGTIVMIDTDEKLKEMEDVLEKIDYKLQTKTFALNYAKALTVKEKLRDRLDVKSVGSIEADERSNQVIVSALPDRMPEIEKLVKALDKKTKEVMIKVKILKLVLRPQFDMGVDWERALTKVENTAWRSLHFVSQFPVSSTISTGTSYAQILMGDVSSDDFGVAVTMLKQVSDTKTLANPTILVVDNEEAKIHIGDKLAYVTTTTTGTGADQTTNEEVHFIDVGILLNVKPTINEDGFIRMSIKPEISSQTDTLTTPQGAEIPLINTTTVESNVMVKDGTTIIIGGLRRDEEARTQKGIPYLMDLPLAGGAFKSVSDDITKTEIVIILTPHIVGGETNITGYKPAAIPMKEY